MIFLLKTKCFLLVLIWAMLGHSEAYSSMAGESAYTRLRAQFQKATIAQLGDFQVGKDWYCSSSLRAAKGQLRYVSLWEHRYQWASSTEVSALLNQNRRFSARLNLVSGTASFVDLLNVVIYESFRVHQDGHLLVEISTKTPDIVLYAKSQQYLRPALHSRSMWAQNYYLCINPQWQGNDDWDYDENQVFSRDDEDTQN